ncbi:hypothetical protein Kfla_4978 [Kribbella flavida DSM 17836]|uniref:Uncharacterized protein n=1 Tax=Kribbella flavida (strain DSM 17836 / JCM 10339 / NBRC 14399) TaxID=479435 RepID=D2Q248_KRIFD|nr:hypothetical protein Kfla_4978 [Kribbella flavida DSM 17836]
MSTGQSSRAEADGWGVLKVDGWGRRATLSTGQSSAVAGSGWGVLKVAGGIGEFGVRGGAEGIRRAACGGGRGIRTRK